MNTLHRVLLLACMLLVATGTAVAAQDARTVDGRVLSAADSVPLSGVRVRVVHSAAGAETDREGRFVLQAVPPGTVLLVLERIGVVQDTVRLASGSRTIVVYLEPAAVTLAPVVAQAATIARDRFENVAQTSVVSLDPVEIKGAPALAEPDVTRVVELLPGTVVLSDFARGFNVRGGEIDGNLLRLDGVTVFNPFHLGGLFSTFNPDAVARVDLLTGGFPAQLGGRLSSVLDVELQQGNRDEVDVRGAVSLLAARVLVSGPVGGTGATFLAGARRTFADRFADAFSDDPFTYYFGDALAKVTVPLGAQGSIAATGYWGRDAVSLPWIDQEPGRDGVDLDWGWGNRVVGVTLRLPIGLAQLEQRVSMSEFSSTLALVPDITRADSDVRLVAARTGLALSGGGHDLRVGLDYEDYEIRYDFSREALATQLLDLTYTPRVWSLYVDEQWRPFGWLLLRPGVRLEHVPDRANFTGLSPRLGIKAFFGSELALTASAGRYHQAIHSIRDFGQPVTLFDFWIGADDLTPVAQSDHVVVGIEHWLGEDVSLTVEGYYKTFDKLVMQNVRDDPRVRGDEFVLAHGDGHGVDLMLRKYRGRVTGWISYGYAKAIRHTEEHPSFSPSHDRRHTLNIVLQAPGPFGSTMGARWGYGSPLPYTGIVGQWIHREYNADEHTFDDFDEESISTSINDRRFPYYSRLDLGFRWQFEQWGGMLRPYVQLINAYDRRNVWFYIFEYDRSPPIRRGYSQLPIFPTFGVEFEW